jgi:uncharacterized repeat protein (TIGR03843 family)
MSPPTLRRSTVHWPSAEGDERTVRLLQGGELSLAGLLPWSSNYTFLGQVTGGKEIAAVVYKPIRGERPLWDFPRGTLAKREVAAYIVSAALGWSLVPPSVLRDGPHGRGSVQLFVEVDQDAHFFTFHEDPVYWNSLQKLALFDIMANNADRKGGHCLAAPGGRVVALDQGLCFNAEPKLRTVIWDFAGEPIPADQAADLRRLEAALDDPGSRTFAQLCSLITPAEIAATRGRLVALLAARRFPAPPEDRRSFPWPLV